MRILAIECATTACSAALFDGNKLIAGTFDEIGRGHAERLVPLIAALPQSGRAERICVSLGPGSFTGVRIGLAAARALSLAWNARVEGYPTLALVAAMAGSQTGGTAPVSVAMSGGHGEWFTQNFDAAGLPESELASQTPDCAAQSARHKLVAGSTAPELVARRGTGTALHLLPDARCLPLLADALMTSSLAPLYGRAPDAQPTVQLVTPADPRSASSDC